VTVWRLAVTQRWIGIFGFTVAFAIACVALGQWQFDRRAQAQAAIALLNQNFDVTAVPLDEVVADLSEFDSSEKWRTVQLEGDYEGEVIYVRTRSGPTGIGFEQLAILTRDDGTAFVVNRGWVPANGDNSRPAETPALPSGPVTVTARLMPGEQLIAGRNAPEGQIATIHLPSIDDQTANDVFLGWYGRLDAETPSAPTGTAWTKPILDEGPHLSYALQWYVFALMGFYGYGWALRKEARGDVPVVRPAKRKDSDEDIEDAALDATPAR
jgi:hypothetical protein